MSQAQGSPPRYCAYFCEENIWHLCAHPRVADSERAALFITNPKRRVAVWGQRLCTDPDLPIAWDYHVVLLFRPPGARWQAWDLDCHVREPQPAQTWLLSSFRGAQVLPPEFLPRFRLVPADDYRRHLRSDRRHMRDAAGEELQPHPSWAPILGEPLPAEAAEADEGHNLDRFLDTENPDFLGRVFDLRELLAHLAQTETRAEA